MTYRTASPVLFIIFNRPETTARVFESIRQAQPERLYVAADGPRPERGADPALCSRTRAVIDQIDWDCQVFTLFRAENLGCKYAVSSAISWFFEHEPEGIILEDDCLPHRSFFRFCDELLDFYRNNEQVLCICGCNFQQGKRYSDDSYYFSRYLHVWGWASWRRAWQLYDPELRGLEHDLDSGILQRVFPESWASRHHWKDVLRHVATGDVDTWDFQWNYACWKQNKVTILPQVNLVKNIGFGPGSTHTTSTESPMANMDTAQMDFPLSHPEQIARCIPADVTTEKLVYGVTYPRTIERIIRKFRKKLLNGRVGSTISTPGRPR